MPGSPRPDEPDRMRDKSAPLESGRPSLEPDPIGGKNPRGDVDRMVRDFLSELNALGQALGPSLEKTAEGGEETPIAADGHSPADSLPAPPKRASYRNIDVLLMDNRQSLTGREREREESPHAPGRLFESLAPARPAGAGRRRIRILICSVVSFALLGTVGVYFYYGKRPSRRTATLAAPSPASPSPSVPRSNTPASPPPAVSPAVPIERVAPRYPAAARRLGVRGTVELDAEVDARGKVLRALAVSGPPQLRSAAAEALLKWRFKPARRGGINIESTVRVSVAF